MEAKELRIGNLLMELTSDDVFEVSDRFFAMLNVNLECSMPIPLTEEWLLKFGFEKNDNFWYDLIYFTDCDITSEDMCISYNLYSGRFSVIDADCLNEDLKYPVYLTKRIKHVHQLQNIYFVLTGEELTL